MKARRKRASHDTADIQMFISEKLRNCTEDGDGVQYMPHPNTAPWHNEYFELGNLRNSKYLKDFLTFL